MPKYFYNIIFAIYLSNLKARIIKLFYTLNK